MARAAPQAPVVRYKKAGTAIGSVRLKIQCGSGLANRSTAAVPHHKSERQGAQKHRVGCRLGKAVIATTLTTPAGLSVPFMPANKL